jgi:hypothetical protein
MVKNKSPFSREFGNSAVIPLGQVIIKNDFHVVFEIGRVFGPPAAMDAKFTVSSI